MANRLSQHPSVLENKVVTLFAQATIGASGAPTLVTAKSKGIASIARNSAGKYTVTLSDIWTHVLGVAVTMQKASGDLAAPISVIRSVGVSSTTPTVVFECYAPDCTTETDPDSGVTVYLRLDLKNSSV